LAAVGALISIVWKGSDFWTTPVLEWICTFLALNFFAVICSEKNYYYDSIHPYGDL